MSTPPLSAADASERPASRPDLTTAQVAESNRSAEGERIVLEEAAERLQVGVREIETGRVRVARSVETFEETIDVPLERETVSVERVPVGSFVDRTPEVRREGDTLVFPVVEEVLVVEKRLRLVEEVRVVQRTSRETATETHTLRRTRVESERLPSEESL
jgi:uncharacterized protein (TIGR02271 family)